MICLINCLIYNKKQQFGPFVYRLGHVVFILERGVRFPQGPPKMIYYVYLIVSNKNNKSVSYVGYTNNIKKRLNLHNTSKGAKFTKGRYWKLAYIKRFKSKSLALKGEYKLKKDYNLRDRIKKKFIKNEMNLIVQIKENLWNNKKSLQLIVLDLIMLPNSA